MNSFEDSFSHGQHSRLSRRRRLVSEIRGWLRQERHPRLTIIGLIAACAIVAAGIGYLLGICGLRSWTLRSFWSVLAVWPAFILLVRWRAAVEFQSLCLGDRVDLFTAHDAAVERELISGGGTSPVTNFEREIGRGIGESYVRGIGGNVLTVILLGGLTFGGWLIWDLINHGATLLSETLLDAEVLPRRVDLITSVASRDWWAEALGLTGIYFGGLAIAAGMAGCALNYLALYH